MSQEQNQRAVAPRPPTFEEARNRRQKARTAGLDPNYWYAVEMVKDLKPGQVIEVKFWGTSVAVFRDHNGNFHAVEDRCAHRHLKLSLGHVVGENLVCDYHGWQYSGDGEVAHVPHNLFGKSKPKCKLRTYPVRVRYGLVWVFFGDAERADSVAMPEIPELEGPDAWSCVPVSFRWRCHHSMVIDNVSDFTHEYLHRRHNPFVDAKLKSLETVGDKVFLSYETKVGQGNISGLFVDRAEVDTNAMDLAYDYPYQWSNTDNQIKHWCLVLPEDENHTRVFFLFYFKSFKVPFLPLRFPKALMKPILQISNRLLVKPLLSEDGVAVEAEQVGWEKHFDEPVAELNPAVHAFQALTVRKWEEHLERERAKRGDQRHLPVVNENDSAAE